MRSLAAGNEVGDGVAIVWESEGRTRVAYAVVASEVPFAVSVAAGDCPGSDERARLVRDQGDRLVSGEGIVARMDAGMLVFGRTTWEDPRERQHERHEVAWGASIQELGDHGTLSAIRTGRTLDISAGGARVQIEPTPDVGTIVDFEAVPRGGEPLRAAAVVVRKMGSEVGLAFLSVVQAARVVPVRSEAVAPCRLAA